MNIFLCLIMTSTPHPKTNRAHPADAGQEPSPRASFKMLARDEVPAPAEITMLGQIKKSL